MNNICCCFQEPDNDTDDSIKWKLLVQNMDLDLEKDKLPDDNDEKVQEQLDLVSQSSDKFDDYSTCSIDDDDDDGDILMPIQFKQVSEDNIIFKTNGNNYRPAVHKNQSMSIDTTGTNTSISSITSLPSIPSRAFSPLGIINSVTSSMDSPSAYGWEYSNSMTSTALTCTNCMTLQHRCQQSDIHLQTIRERNDELEEQIIEAQNNEETSKRLYNELKEDYDRLNVKQIELNKLLNTNKSEYESQILSIRTKLETNIQTLEKDCKQLVKEKNELQLQLNREQDKLKDINSVYMELQNKYSALDIQKARIQDDAVMEQNAAKNKANAIQSEMDELQKELHFTQQQLKQSKDDIIRVNQNNDITINILKEEIKRLNGEIVQIEEDKKSLQESIMLYEQQMKAEQLMNSTQLDMIHEDSDIDVDDDNDDDDDDDDDNSMIIHDDNTLHPVLNHKASPSLSALEPARSNSNTLRLALNNDLSLSALEPATNNNKNNNNINGNSTYDDDIVNLTSLPDDLLIASSNDSSTDIDDNKPTDKRHHRLLSASFSFDANKTPVPSDNDNNNHAASLKLKLTKWQSTNDVLQAKHRKSVSKSGTKSSHQRRNTRQELNVWKDKYFLLKSQLTSKLKELRHSEIEIKSLSDKIYSLENTISKYLNQISSLQNDLNNTQVSYVDIFNKQKQLKLNHSSELNKLKKELNIYRDKLSQLSSDSDRYLSWKSDIEDENKKKDKLYKQQLKMNEKLLNELFELNNEIGLVNNKNEEQRIKLEKLFNEASGFKELLQVVTKKLNKCEKERKAEKTKNFRLNNRVLSLDLEINSLRDTVSNYEKILTEHSKLIQSKDRRIKHLDKQREIDKAVTDKLTVKLKKQSRHLKGFMDVEELAFKKSIHNKDKKMNMVRATNMKLISKLEIAEKTINELKSDLKDYKLTLRDNKKTHIIENRKLQLKISKLTTSNNQIIAQKQELLYKQDAAKKEIELLKKHNIEIIDKIKKTTHNMMKNEYISTDIITFLDKIDISSDNLYKFVDRCRNTFINSNQLTNKLTMQLIEGCDRSINVYYHSVKQFKLLINSCLDIKKRFKNIEMKYKPLEYHKYEIYQSALCSIYLPDHFNDNNIPIISPKPKPKPKRMVSRKMSHKYGNSFNPNITPKYPLIPKDVIRKPIQSKIKKVPIDAYINIYELLSNCIDGSLKNLSKIIEFYNSPLNLTIYTLQQYDNNDNNYELKDIDFDQDSDSDSDDDKDNDDDDRASISAISTLEFDDSPKINWLSLTADPSAERLYPGAAERNDKRFKQIIGEFNDASAIFKKEQIKTVIELDGAWHQFHINVGPTNDLSPKLSARMVPINDNNIDDNKFNLDDNITTTFKKQKQKTKKYKIHTTPANNKNDDDNYLSALTLKVSSVSSQGMHQKRFSIV